MTRFAITLEFDGTPFVGLQRQDNGPSVQEAVERAVFKVTGEETTLHSAGRTDTGVHARGYGIENSIANGSAVQKAVVEHGASSGSAS